MKRSILLLAVVTAYLATLAQSQTPAPLTTAAAKKPAVTKPADVKKTTPVAPFVNYNPLKTHPERASDKIFHVDGESSQPWYVMAGSRPGWSAFPGPGQNNLGFNLFWVGAEPRR
jgi:hypothetical protein